MAYQYPEIRQFAGLHKQANSFSLPDGAMEEASNVVISKDDIVTKRRGFYEYLSTSDTINKVFMYEDTLILVMEDKIAYVTESGTAPNLVGAQNNLSGLGTAVTFGRISRSAQSNQNFYYTTDNGVQKLEFFNSSVYGAGIPPALDMRASFLDENGVINAPDIGTTSTNQVAYRVIFGRRDSNDNLLLSSPSDVISLTNSVVTGSSWARVSNVVTVTTSSTHNLSTGMVISVDNSSGGTPDVVNQTYVITRLSATTYSFAETAADSSGTLDYANTRKSRLEFSIPSEIDTATEGYFYQIYRSSQTIATPSADYKYITEVELTAADISRGFIIYDDEINDIFLGAELYTNPNSQEGELQANARPPLCDDIAYFKNHMFYGKCNSRHTLDLSVIDPSKFAAFETLTFKIDTTEEDYVSREFVGNNRVSAESILGTGTVTITYTSHGFTAGDVVYISNVTGSIPDGEYSISAPAANTFQISSPGNTATALDFQGVRSSGGDYIYLIDKSSASLSEQLRNTAQGIVKAINRYSSSLMYASYTSGLAGVPGQLRVQGKGFSGTISVKASNSTMATGFSPTIPTSFASGTQVFSRNDDQPHVLYISKIGEPEAVPLVNFIPIGSENQNIIRFGVLRDSLIILKEDGIFRLTGDDVGNFTVTALDTTVFCISGSSADILNNQVVFLSNQGFCLVTESSVQLISRKIEDIIQPIVGKSEIGAQTGSSSYESERSYIVTTLEPDTSAASTTYVYNILNDSWVQWDHLFSEAIVGPNDIFYTVATDGSSISRERKDFTKIDYCGQNYSITVTSVESDGLAAEISSASAVPEIGDAIIKNEVFSRIAGVTDLGSNNYSVSFDRTTNLAATDTPILYNSYTSRIKLAPFHAGLVGRTKQFSQINYQFRNNSITKAKLSFTNSYFNVSDETSWVSQILTSSVGGWGFEPWGLFPWGNIETINLFFGTEPAALVRTYLPIRAQRATYVQPILEHDEAGEPINLQSISIAVRAYGERVAR